MLADIRNSLATLSALSALPVVQTAPQFQAAVTVTPPQVLQGQASAATQASAAPQVTTQDPKTQALLVVSQPLTIINTSASPAPPITPWASNDALQNSVAELKRQEEAIAAVCSAISVHAVSGGPGVTPAPGILPIATTIEKSKVADISNSQSKGGTSAEGAGQDILLSRPGKLTAHVGPEVKEKIWKGEFVTIFILIRAKRRDVKTKTKRDGACPTWQPGRTHNSQLRSWPKLDILGTDANLPGRGDAGATRAAALRAAAVTKARKSAGEQPDRAACEAAYLEVTSLQEAPWRCLSRTRCPADVCDALGDLRPTWGESMLSGAGRNCAVAFSPRPCSRLSRARPALRPAP
ncbi:hypothetical protein NDU88_004924 [Pleurodeles waltl]|uniref:Uncharacterized protein n=1 Tax=Pleurodeles waltl TaxID=8319 RepID=A0AAV7VHL7_PLEWA|nr:hypothetical protein NDU88_004924 [Pleurodeles waltl]